MVAVYNIQTGQYIYINNSLKPLLGYENHEWIDKGVMYVSSKIHPDDLAFIGEKNQQALKEADDRINSDSNPIIEFEYRIQHADGNYKWLKTYGTVFDRDELGQVKHVINISLDITNNKETEEKLINLADTLEKKVDERTRELKKSEQKYISIFSTLTEGIALQDTNGKILATNQSASRILNLSIAEIEEHSVDSKKWGSYIHEDGSLFLPEDFPCVIAAKTGKPQKHIIMGILKKKGTAWIIVNSIPLLDNSGTPYAIASSFEEITEQKELDKQKDEFISIASHELKTPLTTIKSFTEILKMKFSKEEKALQYLDKMNEEIDRLTSLVNELLDVSKIQAVGLTLNKESVQVDKFINEVTEDVQTTNTQHKILNKNKSQTKVLMDKYRIYQVLINLINNAIKYSPKSDKISVYTQEKPDRIIFCVKDSGIGISKRDKKKVFDAFFQASTTIRQSHSGLGLGLHIAKDIVTRHGGEISVYSKKGVGSIFKFYLPLEQKNEQT